MSDFGTVTSTTSAGLGGDIVVTVDRLSITGSANVESFTDSPSAGGNIRMTVRESAFIAGAAADGNNPSGIFSGGQTQAGRPGDITLQTGSLTVTQGARIESGNVFSPQGANVTISAQDSIVISQGGGVSALAGVLNVGAVSISASTLAVDGGFISASALDLGRGGDIIVRAGTVTVANGGRTSSSSTPTDPLRPGGAGAIDIEGMNVSVSGPQSGIFSTSSSSAPAGQIRLAAPMVSVTNGGRIDSSTTRGGAGGAIHSYRRADDRRRRAVDCSALLQARETPAMINVAGPT